MNEWKRDALKLLEAVALKEVEIRSCGFETSSSIEFTKVPTDHVWKLARRQRLSNQVWRESQLAARFLPRALCN